MRAPCRPQPAKLGFTDISYPILYRSRDESKSVLADRWRNEIAEVFVATPHTNLVGALSLDMTRLLALVAGLLAARGTLLGALTGEVAAAAAVVALLAVNAVA